METLGLKRVSVPSGPVFLFFIPVVFAKKRQCTLSNCEISLDHDFIGSIILIKWV